MQQEVSLPSWLQKELDFMGILGDSLLDELLPPRQRIHPKQWTPSYANEEPPF